MVKELTVKLSDELYEQLEKLAEKTNKSKAEIIREAILTYIGIGNVSDKAIKDIKQKEIVAIYSGRCSKCGKEIKPGDRIVYVRITYEDGSGRPFTYCLDCWLEVSDKTIVQLELKKRKLEKTIRALNNEINKLIKVYEELEKLAEVNNKLKKTLDELFIFVERIYRDNESEIKSDLKKFISELEDLNNLLADFVRIVRTKKEVVIARYKKHSTLS
jgi:Ribbon-helix-helix protein, copG family.